MNFSVVSRIFSFLLLLSTISIAHADKAGAEKNLSKINLPDGFEITVFAEVPGARQLTLGHSTGNVFAGSREGNVFAIVDKDKDRRADEVTTILTDLKLPNGVAMHQGFLYVRRESPDYSLSCPHFRDEITSGRYERSDL